MDEALHGSFCGQVEDNIDPEKLGRLKVRVPHVYGAVGGVFGAISTDSLPWALPTGLPSGLSQQSGGCDWLPQVGDQVLVRFLDGEPEKPVWEWFMQTRPSVSSFPLHSYASGVAGSPGKPQRGAWVRYGHTVEWNANGLIATTSKGYRLLLTDASATGNDGNILLSTEAGQYIEFDDQLSAVTLNVNEDWHINVGSQIIALADSASLTTHSGEIELISGDYLSITTKNELKGTIGASWIMDAIDDITFDTKASWIVTALENIEFTATQDLSLSSTGAMALSSSVDVTINSATQTLLNFGNRLFLGTGSTEPFVKGNRIFQYLQTLYLILLSHTHPGVMGGSSVTGPMAPVPLPPTPDMLSVVITGK